MARAWTLTSRPAGLPDHSNFVLVEIELPPLEEGRIRVRNHWLSVDPYMRGRMNDVKSYVPPFQVGAPMEGGAIGEVVESRAAGFAAGDLVQHMLGWRDEVVIDAAAAQKIPDFGVPEQAFLGQFGLPGMTAYFGLLDIAEARAGDVVFVSAAAGAVGSSVVQIAKAKGMTVVGSAGGAEKCAWVRSLGADAVVDYKDRETPLVKKLADVAPGGIDVYFDNVGSAHLDAALAVARDRARFAMCGMIDVYNVSKPTELRYLARVIAARIQVKGFIVVDFLARADEFFADMAGLLRAGKLHRRETVHEGLETMPDAFLGLFSGENIGKMLVKL